MPRWVDDASGIESVADAVRSVGWMALDTEADSYHAYFHKLCLIQVSAGAQHFVVDPIVLDRTQLAPLLERIEDPDIPVLMHGADYDMRVLDRDLATHPRALEDTQIMAQLLGEPRTGLAALLDQELGIELDKRYQRADWSRRPLPDSMLAYAARDTAYLHELAARLRSRLRAAGRWTWALEEFRALQAVRYQPPPDDPLAFERVKGARKLKGASRDRLFSLHRWRDAEARRRDVPPFRVLGNSALLRLAVEAPRHPKQLPNVNGVGQATAHRYGKKIVELLRKPDTAPPRQRPAASRSLTGEQRRLLKQLQTARDRLSEELGLDAGVVCPKSVLEAIVRRQPAPVSRDELDACGLEGWRLETAGPELLEAVSAPEGDTSDR